MNDSTVENVFDFYDRKNPRILICIDKYGSVGRCSNCGRMWIMDETIHETECKECKSKFVGYFVTGSPTMYPLGNKAVFEQYRLALVHLDFGDTAKGDEIIDYNDNEKGEKNNA